MTASAAEVEAQEDLAVREDIGPCGEWMQIVERDLRTAHECGDVFLARREVRREQQRCAGDFRGASEFAGRDAFQTETLRGDFAQQCGMRVGLDRVEPAIHARRARA